MIVNPPRDVITSARHHGARNSERIIVPCCDLHHGDDMNAFTPCTEPLDEDQAR